MNTKNELRLSAPPREKTGVVDVSRGEAEMRRVKFGDIAFNSVAKKKPTAEDAARYIGLEHIDPGSFVVSRWGGDVAPIGEKLLMKKGDLLFGKRRAYQRKVAIAPFDGIFSAHGMVLRPKTDVIDERYFPFFIASDQFMDMAVKISVGGLSPTINWKTLKECEFDLPSIERQRELANLLWAASDLKESYKKAITATDEMLKAKFREMFGEAGDTSRGGAESRSSQSKWPMARFDDVALSRLGKMLDARKQTGKWLRPYLANVNVQWFHFDLSDLREMDFNEEDQREFALQDGDLLVCEGGEVGRCAIWHCELKECYFQKAIHRVRCDKEKIIPEYVAFWFLTQSQNGLLRKKARGLQLHIYQGKNLRNFKFHSLRFPSSASLLRLPRRPIRPKPR